MARLKMNGHLTTVDEAIDRAARRTHKGQAHFAGTGPYGKKCGSCKFYQTPNGGRKSDGEEENGRCAKYQQLTNQKGNVVPRYAMACKYWESGRC